MKNMSGYPVNTAQAKIADGIRPTIAIKYTWLMVTLLLISLSQQALAGALDPSRTEIVKLQLPDNWYLGEVNGLEFLPTGDLVVFNRGLHPLMIFDAQGKFKRELGHGLFRVPHGLFVDNQGYIWTTDQETHQVLKFDQFGKILLILGRKDSPGEGWHDNGYQLNLLNAPSDVALDSQGNIFVADGSNYRIVKFDRHGNLVGTWGSKGDKPGLLNFPHSLLIDEQDLIYVTDRQNARIQIFDTQGELKEIWNGIGYPYEIERYGKEHLLISDARSGEIIKLDFDGKVLKRFGQWGKREGEFGFPHGLAVDGSGTIHVGELLNWRVQTFK